MSTRLVVPLGLAVLSLVFTGSAATQEPTAPSPTAPQAKPDLRETEDVSGRVFAARIRNGKVVDSFWSTTAPDSSSLVSAVEKALEQKS